MLFGTSPSRVTVGHDRGYSVAGYGEAEAVHVPLRHAMEVAMESQVKAYEFFDQALPGIRDQEVRRLFEELRDEEAEHQRLLKAEMAKCPETLDPDVEPDEVDTLAM